jgi:hypothetical protein
MRKLTILEEKALEIINWESEKSKDGTVYKPYVERKIRDYLGLHVNASSLIENLIYKGKVIFISEDGESYIQPKE